MLCRVSLKLFTRKNLETNQYNDNQTEIIEDLLLSSRFFEQSDPPKSFPLIPSKESLKLGKGKCILRYDIPIQTTQSEEYAFYVFFHLEIKQV